MNLTRAIVQPGDRLATFPITLPRIDGPSSLSQRFRGMPKLLAFTTLGARDIEYSLQCSLRHDNPTFPFVVITSNKESNKASSLSRKMDEHFANVKKAFPLVEDLPLIYYDSTDPDDSMFRIVVPPRTAVYSSNELFFAGIGFGDSPGFMYGGERPMGGRSKTVAVNNTWGFANETDDTQYWKGESMSAGLTMNAMVGDVKFPAHMQVQVELLPIPFRLVEMEDHRRLPAAQADAVAALSTLMIGVKNKLNLKNDLFDVIPGEDDQVIITNRQYESAGVTVVLKFNEEMSKEFNLSVEREMSFHLASARSIDFKAKIDKGSPFESKYPVVMATCGFGDAVSWVEPLGYRSVFAIIHKRGDQEIILSQGGNFQTNNAYMTVEFVGKDKKVVTFDSHMEISLNIFFN